MTGLTYEVHGKVVGLAEIAGFSHICLAEAISAHGHREVITFDSMEEASDNLFSSIETGDVILTLGAGNVWMTGEKIISLAGGN